jgi:hypothetical protein
MVWYLLGIEDEAATIPCPVKSQINVRTSCTNRQDSAGHQKARLLVVQGVKLHIKNCVVYYVNIFRLSTFSIGTMINFYLNEKTDLCVDVQVSFPLQIVLYYFEAAHCQSPSCLSLSVTMTTCDDNSDTDLYMIYMKTKMRIYTRRLWSLVFVIWRLDFNHTLTNVWSAFQKGVLSLNSQKWQNVLFY